MKTKHWLYIIIVAGIGLRFYNLFPAFTIGMDGIEYARTAELFAKWDFTAALQSLRAPLYPLLMTLAGFVTPNTEWAGRLVSFACGLLTPAICFIFVKRFWGEKPALITAAGIAIHPYLVRYSVLVLSESTATLLFCSSIFLFYAGLERRKSILFCASGLFLILAYLTRPEYVIYFIPLTCMLIIPDRRYRDAAVFLFSFALLASIFLIWIRVDTGYWVIDRKMLSWKLNTGTGASSFYYLFGTISPVRAIKNLPFVISAYSEAVFMPFLLLAIVGFTKTEPTYRKLVLVLVAVHLIARSFVPHTSKRYSVEFFPIIAPMMACGVTVLYNYLGRYHIGKAMNVFLFASVALTAAYIGLSDGGRSRQLEKTAGIFLKDKGRAAIAARLPISSYYAQAPWINLIRTAQVAGSCENLKTELCAQGVRYVILDQAIHKEVKFIGECYSATKPENEFNDEKDTLTIYRVEECTSSP